MVLRRWARLLGRLGQGHEARHGPRRQRAGTRREHPAASLAFALVPARVVTGRTRGAVVCTVGGRRGGVPSAADVLAHRRALDGRAIETPCLFQRNSRLAKEGEEWWVAEVVG